MKRYLILDGSGTVLNVVEMDEAPTPDMLLEGGQAVEVKADADVVVGGTYIDGVYSPPFTVKHVSGDRTFALVDPASREIINVVLASEGWEPEKPFAAFEDTGEGFAMGGRISRGGKYTPPPEPERPPPPEPDRISRRQLRLWLLDQGIRDADVLKAIGKLKGRASEIAMIEWQDSTEFHRSNSTLAQIATALGITDEVLSQGFREASSR